MDISIKRLLKIIFFGIVFLLVNQNIQAQDFNCLDCHNNLIKDSVHDEMIGCQDCHLDVEDIEHIDIGAKKVNCGDCHDDKMELLKTDIHHRLKNKVKNPPNCVTCHGTHQIKSPSESKNIVKDYCSKCHDNIVMANPFHTKAVESSNCFECHDPDDYKPKLVKSVHNNLQCADCHNYVSNHLKNHPENVPYAQKADCYLCHKTIAVEHRESIHGISIKEGINEAAACWDCHGSHEILNVTDKRSSVYPTNLESTCAKCHDNPEFIKKFSMSIKQPGKLYTQSVHGKLVESGRMDAADCVMCHGVHNIKNRVQEGSPISNYNVPETCGQCHEEIKDEYEQSIHWIMAKKGIKEAPVCNDCHSEHSIHAINTVDKEDEVKKLQEQTCLRCHQDPVLNTKYGLNNEGKRYQDSYHGLAAMRGDKDAALCIDCHNVHKILPKSNPESSVNPANVKSTCQKCHSDATQIFAESYNHVTESKKNAKIESIVGTIYFWLIIVVIGGMILHNILIFIFELRKKRRAVKNSVSVPRFTKNEVFQHIILLLSFIILAITGFALKYPRSWWSEGLLQLGLTETIRQNIHRVSAVIMLTLGTYHIIYLFVTDRGREVLKNLLPKLDDFKTAIDSVVYYLGISKQKPMYDKYDYTEKAEYWALVWGTIIMGLTGLLLWFPTLVGDWAPVWLIKVSQTVHFYEAILASLAIVVWHWFFVMFRPSEYPMSFTWIDGKMALDHYRHHHELHFRKVLLDWLQVKKGMKEEKKLGHSTKLFTDALRKANLNPDDIFNSELSKDPELRNWIESEVGDLDNLK